MVEEGGAKPAPVVEEAGAKADPVVEDAQAKAEPGGNGKEPQGVSFNMKQPETSEDEQAPAQRASQQVEPRDRTRGTTENGTEADPVTSKTAGAPSDALVGETTAAPTDAAAGQTTGARPDEALAGQTEPHAESVGGHGLWDTDPASADLRRCGVHPGRCWSLPFGPRSARERRSQQGSARLPASRGGRRG